MRGIVLTEGTFEIFGCCLKNNSKVFFVRLVAFLLVVEIAELNYQNCIWKTYLDRHNQTGLALPDFTTKRFDNLLGKFGNFLQITILTSYGHVLDCLLHYITILIMYFLVTSNLFRIFWYQAFLTNCSIDLFAKILQLLDNTLIKALTKNYSRDWQG